jgi:lipopolysaccharide/colanic/teichoic acid biosynthesis glycosyltransferase
MIENAEQDGAQWAQKQDMRVTRVGEVLRKYRVDELPQLFNILAGDMAFVGPRPERPVFVEQLIREIPYYSERHRVKPGLTGWAQLNYPYGASVADALRKLEYDMYYVKNNSLLLDVMILLQTAEVVLFGRGR